MSSGAQMLAGGVLLALAAAALGEFRDFHPSTVSRGAWLALLYLIVAGSIIAFTAYVWLIHHESPTRVGTYAYVNPVVAVLLGYFLGGEALGLRTILGTLFVLVSVVVITTTRGKEWWGPWRKMRGDNSIPNACSGQRAHECFARAVLVISRGHPAAPQSGDWHEFRCSCETSCLYPFCASWAERIRLFLRWHRAAPGAALQADPVEASLLEMEIRVEQVIERNLLAGPRLCRRVSGPKAVEFDRFLSGRPQEGDERLHVVAITGVALRVTPRVLEKRPPSILEHQMRKIASATGSGANVLDLGVAEVGTDRGVVLSDRLDRQTERSFLPLVTGNWLRSSSIEHEAHEIIVAGRLLRIATLRTDG